MKLIVTIPAYNEEQNIADVIKEIPRSIEGISEVKVLVLDDGSRDQTVQKAKEAGADYIISHKRNKGLANTFQDAINAALEREADIIVNTDGDNHYDQSRIPDLVKPLLQRQADIAIGDREVRKLEHMPAANKYLNILGSYFVSKLFGLKETLDVSSGFRAYNKEAAMRISILSKHTYTHETIIQALDHNLIIESVAIKARKVTRKSRLISNIPSHLARSLMVIFRVFTVYKPLRVLSSVGAVIALPGILLVLRFLYFYFFTVDEGRGHIQSLIIAAILILLGFQVFILGLIASAVGWNRKMLEEIFYSFKKDRYKK
ncbi:MAG: glycosyl transferase [Candidatus Kerfeldbacteria bacterium CG_4_10_14_0_8_um_filter_42_10]|uniref:Glycosyl transferase n=1 Tax=Candidatus Kerfeldbacteria bacterium CG_4_10_14_0_8_um_filter_42_10 TaxID=2014248 RepID=A0A2M7RKR1_9BACT|nr:MAG: glycosyl transferase [Candidatus Kerfeldbacteria bacterium CG_4_10_14_0_8_um_filter_42_10]